MKERLKEIENWRKEITEIENKGIEGIETYYLEEKKEKREGAPHTVLRRRAEKLFNQSLINESDDSPYADAHAAPGDILLFSSIEILLKGFLLEKDPEWFIRESEAGKEREKPPWTPGFSDCINHLRELNLDIEKEQEKFLKKVLDLARIHRNNIFHLGYSRLKDENIEYHYYYIIIDYFLRKFPGTTEGTVITTKKLIQATKKPEIQDLTFPNQEFDLKR